MPRKDLKRWGYTFFLKFWCICLNTVFLTCLISTITVASISSSFLSPRQIRGDSSEYISPLAIKLPFAFFPSTNEMEVAFDLKSPLIGIYFGKQIQSVSPGKVSPGLVYSLFDYGNMIPPYDFERRPRDPKKIDFSLLESVKSGIINNLKFDLDERSTGWCALYNGYMNVPADGIYTINVRPFSNLQLSIDDRMVISTLEDLTYNWKGCAVSLKAGEHKFALTMIAYTIERVCPEISPEILRISGPGIPRQPIPDYWFSHTQWQKENPELPQNMKISENVIPVKLRSLSEFSVEVRSFGETEVLLHQDIKLNKEGKAEQRFSIPDLPDGEYVVDFIVSGVRIRQPMTFKRKHFPFEGSHLGIEHKIYPPFERLNVNGRNVTMVGRKYTMNAFGVFDSVFTKNRQILANPMKLICETDNGVEKWQITKQSQGYTPYVDQAIFTGSVRNDAVTIATSTLIEEDGCAKVSMTLTPGLKEREIKNLYLEIILPDKEAPMFTYINGGEFLRSYYGGNIPRGKNVHWDMTGDTNFLRAPSMWYADPGDSDGIVFDANQDADTAHNFLPYLWLGAVERGIAWFTGEDRYYENDGKQSMLELARKGDNVVLRIYFIRKPFIITKPRTMVYGLVASPTKPMRADWRTHNVPGGGGLPVIAWGAYRCADKYPDNHDFSIVDKIQEARRNKEPLDTDFLNFKDKNRYYIDWTVYETPWLPFVTNSYTANCTYFEEHFIQSRNIEWQIFQDEWAHVLFNRFEPRDANGVWLYHNHYGCTARSYRDFALFYANEWLKRGISLYFDNTYPKIDLNPYSTGFYDGRLISIWTQRDYYRRIYKLLSYYNEKGSEWPLDFTVHMTNSPTIPINTWTTSFLDLEQPYRRKKDGTEIPFPPDYTLSMTLGRTVGVIPHIMYPLRNIGGWTTRGHRMNEHQVLSNWGMSTVHELAPRNNRRSKNTLANSYAKAYHDFGYPDEVSVHNYWEDKPYITVSNKNVYWIALTKSEKPINLILLQSYSPNPVDTDIQVPDGEIFMDAETGEKFAINKEGEVNVHLSSDYGTRMFLVVNEKSNLPDKPVVITPEEP